MLLWRAETRRQARLKADLIEAVACGYGSCQSKDGHQAIERLLKALRR